MKKLFTILFCLALTAQLFFAQTATKPSGDGTSGDPYLIASLLDLKWIAEQVNGGNDFSTNGNFIQTANINASATSGWNSGAGWIAIGAGMNYAFSGSYDGQGYTISNLYINNSSNYGDGLFAYCLGATIKNLGLTNISINSGIFVGGLVGYIDRNGTINSSIINCYVTGSVTSQDDVGGLIGEADNTSINNCYSGCTVTCTGNSPIDSGPVGSAGGLMSNSIDCTISNSYASGSITVSNSASVGGFAGSSNGSTINGTTINNCYSSCSISTDGVANTGSQYYSSIGGFLGDSKNSDISNCYANGSISANGVTNVSRIGGFVGLNGTSINYCYTTSSIAITGTSDPNKIGGFVGVNFIDESTPIYGVINANCYWNSNIYSGNGYGTNPSGATFSATGKTTAEMQTSTPFTGWNTSIWSFANSIYPKLQWQFVAVTDGSGFSQNITPNNANQVFGRFQLSRLVPGITLTALTIKLINERTGLINFKLWSSIDASFNSASNVLLGSTVLADPGTNGTVSFNGFTSPIINSAGTYYFLTADVASDASGTVMGVMVDNSSLTISSETLSSTITNAVLSSNAVALPVELTSFTATTSDNKVTLNWNTATEVNNYGFYIERTSSSLGMIWEKIAFIQGHGNSNSSKSYSFTDTPTGGKEFKYRLKQMDFDGKYKYSDEVTATLTTPTIFSVKQNFPNPFNPTTTIKYELPANSFVTVKVFDVIGREITTLVNGNETAGLHSVNFDAKNLSSGMYIYKVQAGSYTQIKKMLLMK